MDFGCGQGLLSLNLLDKGASEVIGVDNDEVILNFAREKLPKSAKSHKVSFTSKPLQSLSSEYFDYVFTKDAFEHCHDFEEVFFHLQRVLKTGGSLVIGFDAHCGTVLLAIIKFFKQRLASLPWLHLLLPDEVLKNLFNNSSMGTKKKVMKNKIECIDSYLNKITLERFFKAVEANNLEITYCNINAHQNNFLNTFGKLKALFS